MVEKTEFGGSVKRIGDEEMEKRQVCAIYGL